MRSFLFSLIVISVVGSFVVGYMHGKGVKELRVKYPYFRQKIPLEFVVNGSYADSDSNTKNNKTYEWLYSLMDVFSSLLDAGLRIEFFHEFPFTVYPQLPFMRKGKDGYWRLKEEIPLLFSIKAVKASDRKLVHT